MGEDIDDSVIVVLLKIFRSFLNLNPYFRPGVTF
jgi:hypothetical protein